jgi:hypothetical protein
MDSPTSIVQLKSQCGTVRDQASNAAPVSHQKQPHQNATNAIEIEQKRSKINQADRYSAAHNGLVAGSIPARGPKPKTDAITIV